MRTIGILMIIFGVLIGMYAFSMDTSVSVTNSFDTSRVNNIGLMNDKQNILFVGGVLSIMGSIFVAGAYKAEAELSDKNAPKELKSE